MPHVAIFTSRSTVRAGIAAIVVFVVASIVAAVHHPVASEPVTPSTAGRPAAAGAEAPSFYYLPSQFPAPAGPPSEPIATF